MLPYFYLPTIALGPLTIHVWGLMVALGAFVALVVASRIAKKWGLRHEAIWDAGVWILIGAFLGARLAHVFLYDWDFFRAHPVEIIQIWHGGLSSFGGFLGGALSGIWFLRRRKMLSWAWADAFAVGFAPGWAIGRIGCFLTHLHPGTPSNFALAVRYPDGISRHDLGLYESLVAAAISFLFLVIYKKTGGVKGHGMYLISLMLAYGIARFFLDFLRTQEAVGIMMPDARYAGLTPAQYGSLALVATALFFIMRRRSQTS